MQFLQATAEGFEARERLRKKFQKRGLQSLPVVSSLLLETAAGEKRRARALRGMRALGFRRFPILWALERDYEDPEARALVTKVAKVGLSVRNIYYGAPGKFTGGLLLNLLGYQVFRTVFYALAWHLRRGPRITKKNQGIADVLNRDGVVAIPNFLPKADFERLRADFDGRKKEFDTFIQGDSVKKAEWLRFRAVTGAYEMGGAQVGSPVVAELLWSNQDIYEPIMAASKRPINLKPEIAYFEWKVDSSLVGKLHQFDYEDVAHCDVPYSTFKIFYYLNDVDEKNGSFVYVKRSHRVTLARLWYDYKLSVRYYFGRLPENQHDETTDVLFRSLNLKEECMVGKANTLVIANTMGFHRRAVFESERPRQAVFMNFRHLDGWANLFAGRQRNPSTAG